MNMLKWILAGAVLIFLLSVLAMYSLGGSLLYSLLTGIIAVVSVMALAAGTYWYVRSCLWLITQVSGGEECSCLAEAVWVRGKIIWQQFKSK